MIIESYSAEDTFSLGRTLGEKAAAGQIYRLEGDLGAGKTAFAQGFASGLGVKDHVSSPTFTILQIYESGRLPLYHFDVYRIGDPEEMYEIGFEDYFYGQGVTLIEWPGMIEELLPEDCIHISFERDNDRGFDYRKITIRPDIAG